MTPLSDWNVFYSALAQCAAGFVAFFGGFIASKIISNEADHARLKRELESCLLECQKLSARGANSVAYAFLVQDEHLPAMNNVKELINEDKGMSEAQFYYLSAQTQDKRFSDYEPHENILREIAPLIQQKKKHPEQALPGIPRIWIGPGGAAEQGRYQDRRAHAKDEANRLLAEANHQAGLVRGLITEASFSSSLLGFITAILIILFFVGVVFPLSLLPTDGRITLSVGAFFELLTTMKGALLATVAGLFTLVLGRLLIVNRRLKIDQAMIDALERFSEPYNFSPYFGIAKANKQFSEANIARAVQQ